MAKRQASRQSPARRVASSAGRVASAAVSVVKRAAKKLSRGRGRQAAAAKPVMAEKAAAAKSVTAESAKPRVETQPRVQKPRGRQKPAAPKARPKRATSDIPIEAIEAAYTPTQTGSKAGFRDDGRDRQSDQEFGDGISVERFSEEDVLTNKSGNPHIGTHRGTSRRVARDRDEVR